MKATVLIRFQDSVADSGGVAVTERLQALGFSEVNSVRLGRLVEMELEGADREALRSRIDRMCERMLANPEYEKYSIFFHD